MSSQRHRALNRANTVRAYRAGLRRRLGANRTQAGAWKRCASAISENADELQGMTVGGLLEACTRTSERTAERIVGSLGCRMRTKIGDLTARQRKLLIETLRSGREPESPPAVESRAVSVLADENQRLRNQVKELQRELAVANSDADRAWEQVEVWQGLHYADPVAVAA